MKIKIVAAGSKMPGWVEQGCGEYLKRMPKDMQVSLLEIPLSKRHKNSAQEQLKQQEGAKMLTKVGSRDWVVALEVEGEAWSTLKLSAQLGEWRRLGKDIVMLIGGPDGLSEQCRQRADHCWSLSALTLPHPLARLLVIEQLYRAWSVVQGHPYHRQ